MNELLTNITKKLEANRDENRAIQMKNYMKGHFEFLGIASPVRKSILRDIYREASKIPKDEALILIEKLWDMGYREYQYVGMEILDRHKRYLEAHDIDRLEQLILVKSWWDTVDHLAAHPVGTLFKLKEVRDSTIPNWLHNDNIWLNRCCLLYQLFYKEDTDWPALRGYIETLNPKGDFFIQKAIGWALRQYSKVNPAEVKKYVENHDLSGLASREGMKWIRRHES